MTYKDIFEKCKTIGECRRTFVVLVDELEEDCTDIIEIKEAYDNRRKEILGEIK